MLGQNRKLPRNYKRVLENRYDAILFDLLTALLDSWTLWNSVAGDPERGKLWRTAYLHLSYSAGPFRPYEVLVAEAAAAAGYPTIWANQLSERWNELQPWPGVKETLRALGTNCRLGVVTNCSEVLANRAARLVGQFDVVVSAERAGFYKPDPRTYRLALDELGVSRERTLFVAGSPFDLGGAAGVGMQVFWHNHIGLRAPEGTAPPSGEGRDFRDLLDFALGGSTRALATD